MRGCGVRRSISWVEWRRLLRRRVKGEENMDYILVHIFLGRKFAGR
jgi:hypothetical protein